MHIRVRPLAKTFIAKFLECTTGVLGGIAILCFLGTAIVFGLGLAVSPSDEDYEEYVHDMRTDARTGAIATSLLGFATLLSFAGYRYCLLRSGVANLDSGDWSKGIPHPKSD